MYRNQFRLGKQKDWLQVLPTYSGSICFIFAMIFIQPVEAATPQDQMSVDQMAISFPGIIGRTRASAEICKNAPPSLLDGLKDARIIAKARYSNIGMNPSDEEINEEKSYNEYLQTHNNDPNLPDCSIFSRQILNLYMWSSRQGAEFIRKNH